MSQTLKAKTVSYGLIELVDKQSGFGFRYSIKVNGQIKEQSNDLSFMINTFDNKYH